VLSRSLEPHLRKRLVVRVLVACGLGGLDMNNEDSEPVELVRSNRLTRLLH